MNNLIASGVAVVTMTSLELVDFVNGHRTEQAVAAGAPFPSKGYAKLEHFDFMKKVPEVLGQGAGNFSDTYVHPQNGQIYECYRFPKREACLMAMSYSYELQARVFDRMTALEAKTSPNLDTEEGRLRMIQELATKQLLALEENQRLTVERDAAIATKALIGSKREATAMATASAATREANKLRGELGRNALHATLLAVGNATGRVFDQNKDWRPLKAWSIRNGVSSVVVPDLRYGKAHAWPAGAWKAVFDINLANLFYHEEVAA